MSAERTRFEKAAGLPSPDFQTAFNNLSALSMEEMLAALAAVGPVVLQKLFERRFAFARGMGMPRMEYAMSVVQDRKLPLIAPGDLLKSGQVTTAAQFLGTAAPTKALFTLKLLAVDTQSVTQSAVRTKNIQEMKDILASQGNGFELDVTSHPSTLPIGDIKSEENLDKLKELVDPLAVAASDRLVVVFGDLLMPDRRGHTKKTVSGRTFCQVDTSSLRPDNSTLIHEVGHAAGLRHIEEEARAQRPVAIWDETNIMREADPVPLGDRTITVGQGKKFAEAFFKKKK